MTTTGPTGDASYEAERPRRGVIGSVVRRVVPAVMSRVDTEELLEYVDVNAIAEELDLNAVAGRLDVNALAGRLDLDALVARLDVDAVASRLDLDALVARLDIDAVAGRLDLHALVDRLDVDALAARLDLDALVARLDVDAVAGRLDLDALVDRLDMARLTAGATQDVAFSGLDLARRQLVRADSTVDRVVDRVIGRSPEDRPVAPRQLLLPSPVSGAPTEEDVDGRRSVSGHYAGPVSRLAALAGDVFASLGAFGFVSSMTLYLFGVFTPADVTLSSGSWPMVVFGVAWFLLWFWVPVALFDRTPAMAVVGLAVVSRQGSTTSSLAAFIRAVAVPLSLSLFALGLIGLFLDRERRTLHDVLARTAVVYDWGEREAERPATVRELLTARVNRVRARRERAVEV